MTPRPPRPTLFPYTTLFRSQTQSTRVSENQLSPRPPCRHSLEPTRPSSCFRRSEEHTSELQSHSDLVCRLLLEKKNRTPIQGRLLPQRVGRQRQQSPVPQST